MVWGITAAMSVGYLKWIFFLFGMLYGFNTYFHAAKVRIQILVIIITLNVQLTSIPSLGLTL